MTSRKLMCSVIYYLVYELVHGLEPHGIPHAKPNDGSLGPKRADCWRHEVWLSMKVFLPYRHAIHY